ncbi:alpha/beta hydrolase [Kiloniella majae]|uniref:alpha/beta hydrolase n=1 Tax=Kiloniella majae TaxID=1938558 RepID=UPI001302B577|nr:alpha/beta fold hydrolase [Kiloniella majae]
MEQIVLIIPGSGPTDRNGNNPLGVSAGTYKLLAEDLAKKGISSLRIDKRGLYGSSSATENPNNVTVNDYVEDIIDWISLIKEKLGCKNIWLLGHSEGGLIALKSTLISPTCSSGLILVATSGVSFGQLLRKQINQNLSNTTVMNDAFVIIDQLENGQHVEMSLYDTSLQQLFAPVVQDYLIDLMSHEPVELISEINIPTLILQGDQDIQVSVENANKLKKAQPRSKLVILNGVNHILKQPKVQKDKALTISENLASYRDPKLELAPKITKEICQFIIDQN